MQCIRGEGCTIGSRSEFKVLNTTPLHPASKDCATISALLETGDDDSRKDKSTLLATILPPNPGKPEFRNTNFEIRNKS